jgi:hypothetical protein
MSDILIIDETKEERQILTVALVWLKHNKKGIKTNL